MKGDNIMDEKVYNLLQEAFNWLRNPCVINEYKIDRAIACLDEAILLLKGVK